MQLRMTLMLTYQNYRVVSELAKKSKAPRNLVLDALIASCDESKVLAKVKQLQTLSKADKVDGSKSRQELAELTRAMPPADLAALVAGLRSGSLEFASTFRGQPDRRAW